MKGIILLLCLIMTTAQAELCGVNQHVVSNKCIQCADGRTNVAGDDASGQDTNCECLVDEHVVSADDGSLSCAACPDGTTNKAGDDPAANPVETSRTWCANEHDHCSCKGRVWYGKHHRWAEPRTVDGSIICSSLVFGDPFGGTFKQCDCEVINDPDDASGGPTNCDITYCAKGENVVENVCTPCPPGTTNIAGDDASGDNTICTATLCGPNENVVSNVCTACPPGSTNIDGNHDASGNNTNCDITYCAKGENVVENVCVACPPGSTNIDGNDDASGNNTNCELQPSTKQVKALYMQLACEPDAEIALCGTGTEWDTGDKRCVVSTWCGTTCDQPTAADVSTRYQAAGQCGQGASTDIDLCGPETNWDVGVNSCVARFSKAAITI